MQVIGVVGLNASGKDALLEYLHQRCGLPIVSSGDIARDLAMQRGLAPTRDNLHHISTQYIARYGTDYFMRQIVDIIEREGWTAVGITGIRTPDDVRTLKQRLGNNFVLVYVHVSDPHLRYERARQRAEARDPTTFAEFAEKDREEEELFHIRDTIQYADMIIDNSSTIEAFHQQIEEKIVRGRLGAQLGCNSNRV
ncbi:MAG: AAA family ATPase [Chloroflexi bacterium]|jgi:dephospho-CoA kinase|nr:AAA family ATPase [Chloroflexota bacterium]